VIQEGPLARKEPLNYSDRVFFRDRLHSPKDCPSFSFTPGWRPLLAFLYLDSAVGSPLPVPKGLRSAEPPRCERISCDERSLICLPLGLRPLEPLHYDRLRDDGDYVSISLMPPELLLLE